MSTNEPDDQFVLFVAERSPRLLVMARHLCGDPQIAEALTQAALERTCVRWARIARTGDPYAYVRRQLINLNSHRLGRRPWRERPVDHGVDSNTVDFPLENALPPDELARALDRLAVRRVLGELTPKERGVVVLRYLENLSESETAAELGIKVTTVQRICHRTLDRMQHLTRQLQEEV